jgi:hypothetical protein
MTTGALPPFSARNRRDTAPVDEDFPSDARTGLLHLIKQGVGRNLIRSWETVAEELQRIVRVPPSSFSSEVSAHATVDFLLETVTWDRAYDFCERIHSHLAVGYEYETVAGVGSVSKTESQQFFADELQRLFQEENLAYEFRDGAVQRRGRRHTVDRMSKAEGVLVDSRLATARQHFAKAQRFFRDRVKPDPENAVKEAVCAVEAAAKELFPNAKAATLGDAIKWLTGPEPGKLPKAISHTLTGLYAFRSGAEGVGHGGATGGAVTTAIAEYVLAVAASQIILLVELASASDEETPF